MQFDPGERSENTNQSLLQFDNHFQLKSLGHVDERPVSGGIVEDNECDQVDLSDTGKRAELAVQTRQPISNRVRVSAANSLSTTQTGTIPVAAIKTIAGEITGAAAHSTTAYPLGADLPTNSCGISARTAITSSHWRRAFRRVRWRIAEWPVVGSAVADPGVAPTPWLVADWRARGHEFGIHPYVEEGLETGWHRYWNTFTGLGYGPVPPTVRTHRVLWQGWVESARVQATYGLRMNLDFYHVGPSFQTHAGEWVFGHFAGSGLPMKFVDEQGRILRIYQQVTQLVDEHLLEGSRGWGGAGWVGLSAEAAVEVSRALLRRSLDGAYSAVAAQFHVDAFAFGGSTASEAARWLEGTLDYAAAQGIPIWSATEWLRFTEARHDAALDEIQWTPSARRLSFQLVTPSIPDVELSLMLPLQHISARLDRVEVDGVTAEHRAREVGGTSYGWISIQAGTHQVVATYL